MKTLTLLILITGITAYSQDYDGYANYDDLLKAAEDKGPQDGRKVLETGRVMTLKNAEILPGSCWDYANAVYDRAGYSWGMRENVYKTQKSGPYADVSKIKNGDWLYYVNHSYGDIEHSAIFVDWIDIENKTALMLSYGGESRNEPARYLPYDLSSVFGITRANSKLSESKPVVKVPAANANSVNKPATNTAISSANTAVSAKPNTSPETSKPVDSKPIAGVTADGIRVDALKFGSNVASMEIVGESSAFAEATGKVYCWMRIAGGQGKAVKVRWIHNGNSLGEVPLEIRSDLMRTYAFRTINGRKGDWKVEIVSPSGTVLHSAGFIVN